MFKNWLHRAGWDAVNALMCSACQWRKYSHYGQLQGRLCLTTGLQVPDFIVCSCETGSPHIGKCPEGAQGVWVCVHLVNCWNLNIPNSTLLIVEVAEITVNEY